MNSRPTSTHLQGRTTAPRRLSTHTTKRADRAVSCLATCSPTYPTPHAPAHQVVKFFAKFQFAPKLPQTLATTLGYKDEYETKPYRAVAPGSQPATVNVPVRESDDALFDINYYGKDTRRADNLIYVSSTNSSGKMDLLADEKPLALGSPGNNVSEGCGWGRAACAKARGEVVRLYGGGGGGGVRASNTAIRDDGVRLPYGMFGVRFAE